MKIVRVFFVFLIIYTLMGCEQKNIDAEIARLQELEKEVINDISEKRLDHAKLICVKMKWGYVATTAGAAVKCKKLAEIWDEKRRNYLTVIGVKPDDILGKKPKPKSFQERLLDGE